MASSIPGSKAGRFPLLARLLLTACLVAVLLPLIDLSLGFVMQRFYPHPPFILPNLASGAGVNLFWQATQLGDQPIVFTGSSTMWTMVSPGRFDETLGKLSGLTTFSLNVSLTQSNAALSRDLIDSLLIPGGARVIIYGAEIRAVNSHLLDQAFLESPLGYTVHLPPGIEKSVLLWLLQHSTLARYQHNFQDIFYPTNYDDYLDRYTDQRGYYTLGTAVWSGTGKPSSEYIPLRDDQALQEALGDMATTCQKTQTRCVVVNLPLHPLLKTAIGTRDLDRFAELLNAKFLPRGVEVWNLNTSACEAYFGNTAFADDHHMNDEGATKVSTLLAEVYASEFLNYQMPSQSAARCVQVFK